jgi:hypothetical protein
MFAGLPGIGVGTLFYVLSALWMPLREFGPLVKGESSIERWRLIAVQFSFAISIIASVAVADRLLAMSLRSESVDSMNPGRWLNQEITGRAPESILAAPIMASLLLLAGVLVIVEGMRIAQALSHRRRTGNPKDSVVARGSEVRAIGRACPLVLARFGRQPRSTDARHQRLREAFRTDPREDVRRQDQRSRTTPRWRDRPGSAR